MAKHTPGPWEAVRQPSKEATEHFWTIEAMIVGSDGPVADTLNQHHCIDPEEELANAKLIAAAPDLLVAATIGLHCLKQGWITPEELSGERAIGFQLACKQFSGSCAVKMLEDAIAKAEVRP